MRSYIVPSDAIKASTWQSECFASHMGLWLVEPMWFTSAVASIKAGAAGPALALGDNPSQDVSAELIDGIAHIPIMGPLSKSGGKFGQSTVRTRGVIREAAASDRVAGIMLHVDSPGGSAFGTEELAQEVARAASVKPVHSHVSGLAASAAYWAASASHRITAAPVSEVGSIGTVAVVEDSSGAADAQGISVHVISTGDFKGAFAPGAPVSEEHLSDLQRRVDAINSHFLRAVQGGRKMPKSEVASLADGRVHISQDAANLGLIDGVGSLEQAIDRLAKDAGIKRRNTSARSRLARARMREAGDS
ncbi:MAG: S49 family peptidase [Acidimicrobiia bacterium]|nr:S49 family peptidase [Acidimicrobiia bacterium]